MTQVASDSRIAGQIGVVHIELSVRVVGRVKGHAEEASFTSGSDQIGAAAADIQKRAFHAPCREVEDLDSPSLFDNKETRVISRNGSHEDRG